MDHPPATPFGQPPRKRRKRRPRKLPVFLDAGEAERLVAAARCQRDRVLILCGLHLGMRCAELCALRVERVDLAARTVFVFQGKNAKDRLLPVSGRLEPELRAWLGDRREGWVFPSPRKPDAPLTTRAVRLLVAAAAKRAGITRPDPSQTISPHKLRHTFGSRLVARGVDLPTVRDLLGHSNLATTSIYCHTDVDRMRSAVDKL